MAKFKPIRPNKPSSGPQRPAALPCFIVLIGVFALLALLFYSVLSGVGS